MVICGGESEMIWQSSWNIAFLNAYNIRIKHKDTSVKSKSLDKMKAKVGTSWTKFWSYYGLQSNILNIGKV